MEVPPPLSDHDMANSSPSACTSSRVMLLFGSTRTWVYHTCHEHLNACRNFRSLNPERGVVLASCIHMSTPCARLEYVASTLHRSRSFICWLTTLGSANVVAESSRIRAQDSCELIAKLPATTCSESAMSQFQLLVLHLSRDNHQVASSLRYTG